MYRYIEGKLVFKEPAQAVIDVGGIGFEIIIPLSIFHDLPAAGEPVRLLTHFHVREDSQQLFGFLTGEELELFRLLLTVSGIGPKSSLAILSGIGAEDLKYAIVNQKQDALTAISGVGRKTAERIIVELREKVGAWHAMPVQKKEVSSEIAQSGISALTQLGYKKQEAQEAVRKVLGRGGQTMNVSELVKESLKNI